MTLGWCITRSDPSEAAVAQEALNFVRLNGAEVPALWYLEILNALLAVERANHLTPQDSLSFLSDLSTLWIVQDSASMAAIQSRVLTAARTYRLMAYAAACLELAQRKGATPATFDRELAQAFRQAGGCVFGDRP